MPEHNVSLRRALGFKEAMFDVWDESFVPRVWGLFQIREIFNTGVRTDYQLSPHDVSKAKVSLHFLNQVQFNREQFT